MLSKELILSHSLVPKHEVVSNPEEMLASLGMKKENLPKIRASDPVATAIGAKEGSIVKITRKEATGENVYYRLVVR